MRKRLNLVGNTYGRLSVTDFAYVRDAESYFVCKCICEEILVVRGRNLIKGNTKSCGCFKRDKAGVIKTTHGQSKSPEYVSWNKMRERCSYKKNDNYKYYGGRGIQVCTRWLGKTGFINFLSDMGRKPTKKHSIDRIDVNGNYEPSNCRWATQSEQVRNQRRIIQSV